MLNWHLSVQLSSEVGKSVLCTGILYNIVILTSKSWSFFEKLYAKTNQSAISLFVQLVVFVWKSF